jgi:hypothetical protein
LEQADSPATRARLLAASAPHSNAWLEAVPVASLGLKLDDSQLRIAVGLQLGGRICAPHTCVCGQEVDASGTHGLSCNKNAGRYSRHAEVNDLIYRALTSAKVPSVLEPPDLSMQDGSRPDGLTLIPWAHGKSLAWDFTCCDTLAASHVGRTSVTAGAAAAAGEQRKHTKYAHLQPTFTFLPIAVETMGTWGPEARLLPFFASWVGGFGRRRASRALPRFSSNAYPLR